MSSPFTHGEHNPLADLQRRARNGLIIQGVLAGVIGIIMFAWPGATLSVFALLVAAWLIVNGVLGIVAWWRARRRGFGGGPALFAGLLSLVAGIIISLLPETAVFALVLFIAFWAIVLGVLQIAGSLAFRRFGSRSWWVMLISGIAGLVIGFVLIANPAAGAISLLWLIAAFLVLAGVAAILFGIRLGRAQVPGTSRPRGSGRGDVIESETVDRPGDDPRSGDDPRPGGTPQLP